MKAVVITQPGNIEQLQICEIEEPTAPDGYVKLRTKAFGLNRAETYFRAGNMGEIKEPRIPGIEAAGEIVEDNSGKFRVGQKPEVKKITNLIIHLSRVAMWPILATKSGL